MGRHHTLVVLGCVLGCGGRDTFTGEASDEAPTMLFVRDEEQCAREAPVERADDELDPIDSGEELAVVEIAFAGECTGEGGDYVVARALDGFTEMWLGGHACRSFDQGLIGDPVVFGAARYGLTAALFEVPADLCVGFPGEAAGLTSSVRPLAIAVFATREGAEGFVR